MRLEFTRSTRRQAYDRANGHCEGCGAALKPGEGECDHILPRALGGDSTLGNCQVLCRICHRGPNAKTGDDIRRIRKADRQRDRASGAKRSSRPMPGSRHSPWKQHVDGTWTRREGRGT